MAEKRTFGALSVRTVCGECVLIRPGFPRTLLSTPGGEYFCCEVVALNAHVVEMTTLVLPQIESLAPGVNWVRQCEKRRRLV